MYDSVVIFYRRLLETDSKSLYSVNCVLRSPSFSKAFPFDEDFRAWGCVVEKWDEWSRKKVKQLKEMIRKGIHPQFRPTVWQMLCNAHSLSVQGRYSELLQEACPCEKAIEKDLNRILPQHQLFQGLHSGIQQPLFNVLKAYSVLDQEIGYHQGTAFIAGLLLTQMPEVEAFAVFLRLMQDFRLRELYRPQMVELGCCMFQLEWLIQEQLPELYSHFQTHAFYTSTFFSSWFLTVFLSCLPITAANRVFDIFMCEVQQTNSSGSNDLQGDLMSLRFKEVHTQAQLAQNRHILLQLQTQDQLCSLQLKHITERMHSQRKRLQELMMQNQRMRSLLGQTAEGQQHEAPEDEEAEDSVTTVRKLQHQIAQLQAQ
ncbi:hypothetical protein NFI96_020164, partial [Prochilodus magdalenae]